MISIYYTGIIVITDRVPTVETQSTEFCNEFSTIRASMHEVLSSCQLGALVVEKVNDSQSLEVTKLFSFNNV